MPGLDTDWTIERKKGREKEGKKLIDSFYFSLTRSNVSKESPNERNGGCVFFLGANVTFANFFFFFARSVWCKIVFYCIRPQYGIFRWQFLVLFILKPCFTLFQLLLHLCCFSRFSFLCDDDNLLRGCNDI